MNSTRQKREAVIQGRTSQQDHEPRDEECYSHKKSEGEATSTRDEHQVKSKALSGIGNCMAERTLFRLADNSFMGFRDW